MSYSIYYFLDFMVGCLGGEEGEDSGGLKGELASLELSACEKYCISLG